MTTTTSTTLPYVSYRRVSRVGGRTGDSYITLPEQQRTNEALAARAGVPLLDDDFVDEDRSGGSLDRPAFQRALSLIREGKAGGIVVATSSRFSRDTEDLLGVLREIEEEHGARVISGDGQLSLQGIPETLMTTIRAAIDTNYRLERGKQLDDSIRNAIERGVHLGIPFGYMRPDDQRGKALVVNPVEADTVRLAFQLRAEGLGWQAIAKQLNDAGMMPRPRQVNGKWRQAKWSHQRIARMIDQEVYRGVAHAGQRRTENAHEAIVSRTLWDKAHQSAGAKFKANGDEHLLTGLIRCAACGFVLVRVGREPNIYYSCRHEPCTSKARVRLDELEAWVVGTFAAEFGDVQLVAVSDDEEVGAAVANLDQRKAEWSTAVRRMMTLPDDDQALLDEANKIVAEAKAAMESAQRELARAKAASQRVSLPDDFDADTFDKLEVSDQRHLLSTVYAMVAVRRAATSDEPLADRVQRVLRAEEVPTDKYGLLDLATRLQW